MRKAATGFCLALALGVLGYWYSQGPRLATLTKEPVEVTEVDDFGDEVTRIEWRETFVLGLDIAGPVAGSLLVLAGALAFLGRRPRS